MQAAECRPYKRACLVFVGAASSRPQICVYISFLITKIPPVQADRRRIGDGVERLPGDTAQAVATWVILRGVGDETLHPIAFVNLQLTFALDLFHLCCRFSKAEE